MNDNYYGAYVGYKGRVEEERGPGWEPVYDLTLEGLELVGYRKVQVDLPSDSEWERQKDEAAATVFDEDDTWRMPTEIEMLIKDVHSALLSGRVYGWYARAKELILHNFDYYLSDPVYNDRHEKAHPCRMPRWPTQSESACVCH